MWCRSFEVHDCFALVIPNDHNVQSRAKLCGFVRGNNDLCGYGCQFSGMQPEQFQHVWQGM